MQRRPLSGTYECSLDSRHRLAIPARVREPFGEGATVGWWIDECLIITPAVEWPTLIERTFGTMSVLDDEARDFRRFVLAGAFHHDLDGQGRVPLAPELREYGGIDGKRVKVIGAGDYLEVWNPDRLAARFAKIQQDGGLTARAQRLADRIA